MRRKPKDDAGIGLSVGDGRVDVRTPLASPDGRLAGFLAMAYDASDPLTVDVSVRSPGDSVVLSRVLLRSDLDLATGSVARTRDLTVAPMSGDRMRFVFYEGRAIVEACAPVDAARGFLRATERLVPRARETSTVDRLIRTELLEGSGFPGTTVRE